MRLNYGNTKLYEKKLLDFCTGLKKIYLYGAGVFGKTYYHFLSQRGIQIDGFITTDAHTPLFGLPVYKASEILDEIEKDSGIILSVKEEFQDEIKGTISFPCDLLEMKDIEYAHIEALTYLRDDYFVSPKRSVCNGGAILIVQLEVTFGDMIWSTAFLRELKKRYPDKDIDFVMNEKFREIYRNCPYLSHIYGYDCSTLNDSISFAMVEKVASYIRDNIHKQYSIAFLPRLLPFSCSDAWENILLAVHLGIPQIFGHALYILDLHKYRCDLLHNILTGIFRHEEIHHEAVHDIKMLSLVGVDAEDDRMELWPSKKLLIPRSEYIRICVALVGSAASRSWDAHKYGVVLKRILEKYNDIEVFLCGGADAVASAKIVEHYLVDRYMNITNQTSLDEIIGIISDCDIYLGSDTGLMHVASAFNKYVIEISASIATSPDYWGSSPQRTGPWCDNYKVIRPSKGKDSCRYMCVKPYAHCINQISEDEVFKDISIAIDFFERDNYCI